MKKIISITLFAALFFFESQSLYAQQNDSISGTFSKDSLAKKNDSVNSAILKKFNEKLN